MKLQQLKNGQFFVSLPQAIVRAKGWIKGKELICKITDKGELLIKEK